LLGIEIITLSSRILIQGQVQVRKCDDKISINGKSSTQNQENWPVMMTMTWEGEKREEN
jgi:hypothetical protein